MSPASASPLTDEVETAASHAPRITSSTQIAASRLEGTVWQHWGIAARVYAEIIRLGRWLGQAGVAPDALTYSALAVAMIAASCAATGHFAWAAVALLASGACDLLDGVIAREMGRTSAWGALLDSSVDRVADSLPLLGVLWFFRDAGWGASLVPLAAMLSMFLLSYVRARAESLGAKLPPLFMRRAERLLLLCAAFLLSPFELSLATGGSTVPALLIGVGVIGVLSFVGLLSAMAYARRLLN